MPSLSSLVRRFTKKIEDKDGKYTKRRLHFSDLLRFRSQRAVSPTTGIFYESSESPTENPIAAPDIDSNKPLPPPPKLGSEIDKTPRKPPVQLERIISPLKDDDLSNLFSGAPHFYVRSEDDGTLLPSIEFPYNGIDTRHLRDYREIEHDAFKCSSIYSRDARKDQFWPNVKEKPDVLSLQGLERGTTGFRAALESRVADAFQEVEDSRSESDLSTTRAQFFDGNDRVRPLNQLAVIIRLSEIGDFYHHQYAPRPSNVDLYTMLFTQALFPPTRVTDLNDPYSLAVQIEELIFALSSAAFNDFSIVEMRIRLGQMLWKNSEDGDDMSVDSEFEIGLNYDKEWLLLQILLSCELLIRLDLAMRDACDAIPAEIHLFNERANLATKWGLLLARRWLENILINIPEHEPAPEKAPSGWLAYLTRAEEELQDDPESSLLKRIIFESRHTDTQLSGLILFAKKLGWENMNGLASRSLENKPEANASPATRIGSKSGTPMSTDTGRSYFGSVFRRPSLRRSLTQQQRIYAVIHPSGWLSCSYLTGFILPGEATSHLLMSTLLENDSEVMNQLGEETTLYGGFIYAQRSYWSTFCIVGRVLAAGDDARECMGWVSSSIKPQGLSDRWVDIEVQEVTESSAQARIWEREAIERQSSVFGDGDKGSNFSSDFVLPRDLEVNDHFEIIGQPLLVLSTRADSTLTTPMISTPGLSGFQEPATIQSYDACMSFDVRYEESKRMPNPEDQSGIDEEGASADGDHFTLTVFLINDVQFVTAHPCFASSKIPSIISPNSSPSTSDEPTGHPLHKSYKYIQEPLSSIIQSQLSGEMKIAQLQEPSIIDTVLIIDCTSTSQNRISSEIPPPNSSPRNLEMLARAYCSENEFNALISRKGRSCISCSVREARALGFRVIIRVGVE